MTANTHGLDCTCVACVEYRTNCQCEQCAKWRAAWAAPCPGCGQPNDGTWEGACADCVVITAEASRSPWWAAHEIAGLKAEIASLKGRAERLTKTWAMKEIETLKTENRCRAHANKRLTESNQRLKQGLDDIAEHECDYGDGCPRFVPSNHYQCIPCKAREALAEAAAFPGKAALNYVGGTLMFSHRPRYDVLFPDLVCATCGKDVSKERHHVLGVEGRRCGACNAKRNELNHREANDLRADVEKLIVRWQKSSDPSRGVGLVIMLQHLLRWGVIDD
jgi:ElaB/YqjD/DUF883 family membrane-anchored ribosome-binding protein